MLKIPGMIDPQKAAKLYEKIGRLTVALEEEREKVQATASILKKVCSGELNPEQVVFTDTGFHVVPFLLGKPEEEVGEPEQEAEV